LINSNTGKKTEKVVHLNFRIGKRIDPEFEKILDEATETFHKPEEFNKKYPKGKNCPSDKEILDHFDLAFIKFKTQTEEKEYKKLQRHIFSCKDCRPRIINLSIKKEKGLV